MERKPTKMKKEERRRLENMIECGTMRLLDIGRELGMSRQGAAALLERHGLHRFWKKQRKKGASEEHLGKGIIEQAQRDLAEAMKVYFLCEEYTKGWAEGKAAEYAVSGKTTLFLRRYDYDDILDIFRKYHRAKIEGKKHSLNYLFAGIHPMEVRSVLGRVGLRAMHPKGRKHTADEMTVMRKKVRLLRKLGIPDADSMKFLGVSKWIFNNDPRQGMAPERRYLFRCGIGSDRKLTYHAASGIYRRSDTRRDRTGLDEELGLHKEVVAYALRHRREIEPMLLKIISIIEESPARKPYLSGNHIA